MDRLDVEFLRYRAVRSLSDAELLKLAWGEDRVAQGVAQLFVGQLEQRGTRPRIGAAREVMHRPLLEQTRQRSALSRPAAVRDFSRLSVRSRYNRSDTLQP